MKLRSKSLRRLYENGDGRGVAADQLPRLRLILTALEHSANPRDMDQPGFRLHRLKPSGPWSVRVSANWRVTFDFFEGEAVDVDLVDYH